MKSTIRLIFLIGYCFLFPSVSEAQPLPKGVSRVLFLGNSITYDGRYVNDVIAYVRMHYPKSNYTFINIGLPSETVSGLSEPNHADGKFPRPDLHERLERVLTQIKPDLVFACYGMNDGIYMPFDSSRFKAFQSRMEWLHQEVEKAGARIIHSTPPLYDDGRGGATGYAQVLDDYSDWLINQRERQHWEVIDLHFPMKAFLEQQKKRDSTFYLAQDGVHPGALGHWLMAREMLRYLVKDDSEKLSRTESLSEALGDKKNADELVKLITEQQQIVRNAWLSATGHKRPGLPSGLPLDQAQKQARSLEKKIRKLL
ncbi:SGNH/GDSL hydrolase family protein [Siphonobacter sp. SORGH_AS_1065]|uniref:SGNH/GDSL hydrolase family protein n=1 Tax=Siphonobacter sp. SORGH_AS_1065 TaxID=3041795 RepID=UPI0027869D48|nr:SGNH/GDSL hydrolase family protein [Siphonobacter sp. SORGH_AS_1065]MDQ1089958.1 lysophospholipase L1-like esterase [Siphonobacter sp. SORGH_AS_1065]